jgi:hypothetical protein
MPAVGYHDGTNTHPSVARHVGAGGNCGPGNSWQCEALGLSGGANQGEYVSLAFETDGRTGLFYYDVTNSINRYDGPFTPHGFFQFGSPVDIQNLVQDTTGKYNSARFDLYGIPHVAYFNQSPTNALRYATYVTSTTNSGCSASATWEWQCDTIESFLGFGSYPSLDLNFIGQPRIAYVGLTSLKLATYLGSGGNCGQGSQLSKWRCEIIDDTVAVHEISLHVPKCLLNCVNPTTQIAYYDTNQKWLKYTRYVGSNGNCGPGNSWRCDMIETVGFDAGSMAVSLAVDGNDNPIVAYHDADDLGHGILKLARYTGGSGNCGPVGILLTHTWQCDVVDDGGGTRNVGEFASLVLDSAGLAIIAYYDATNHDLYVAFERFSTYLPLVTR